METNAVRVTEAAGKCVASQVELVEARNGLPSLRVGGVCLHSAYDPAAEADSWARRAFEGADREDMLWVVLGCGLGYHARALSDRGARRIVVFEPDPRIEPFRQEVDAGLEQDEAIIITTSLAALREAFRARFPDADGTRIVMPPAFERIYHDQLADARDQIDNCVQEFRVSRFTYINQARFWMTLTAGNLTEMLKWPSVDSLRGFCTGKPAVIISAGPSLDKNIHQLAEVADRVSTLCPSQSLKAAKAAGIRPDLVLVADSHNLSYQFAGCGPDDYGALVVAAKCHAEVAALPARQKLFYCLPPNPLAEFFFELRGEPGATLPSGASVSNIALHLADAMDADPVILIGQDLAFSGEQMYASGTADGAGRLVFHDDGLGVSFENFSAKRSIADADNSREIEQLLTGKREVYWVRGLDGQRLPTTVDMKSMLSNFERFAPEIAERRRLINATEGGAFIRGMEHSAFAQASADLPEQGAGVVARLDELGVSPEATARAVAGLVSVRRDLAELRRIAQRCVRVAGQVRKGRGDARLGKLAGCEKKLNRSLGRLPAINAMVQDALVRFRTMGDPDSDDLKRNLERSLVLYRAIEQAAGRLWELIGGAIQKGAAV